MKATFFNKNLRNETPKNPAGLKKLLDFLGVETPTKKTPIDDLMIQRTAVFKQRPKVILVTSLKKKRPVRNYTELPKFHLNENETSCVNKISSGLKFDGDNILVTDCDYNEHENTLFLQCVQSPYSVIRGLSSKDLERDSFYFKTGVMSPLICNDQAIIFLRRNDAHKLFSAPAGFLQPINAAKDLMLSNGDNELDLVELTVIKELHEELLEGEEEALNKIHLIDRLGLSVRYPTNYSLPTAELVLPVEVPYSKDELIKIIENNNSQDAEEHTGEYWVFDYKDREAMRASLSEIGSKKRPGWFLYLPMLKVIFPTLEDKISSCLGDIEKNSTKGTQLSH